MSDARYEIIDLFEKGIFPYNDKIFKTKEKEKPEEDSEEDSEKNLIKMNFSKILKMNQRILD